MYSVLFCNGMQGHCLHHGFTMLIRRTETGQFLVVCREVRAFIFVFEEQHRIVLETPEYGNATYFFELEAPMPVAAQVRVWNTSRLQEVIPKPKPNIHLR